MLSGFMFQFEWIEALIVQLLCHVYHRLVGGKRHTATPNVHVLKIRSVNTEP